ncbi:two-component hybrid sensor and regulator [Piscinibacter sakaiensis]|uniref:histidine kinase n=1 Tax=Piscinibacter sakaiensis TaxID=1547922 RepID=A0A0K8P6N7_PISS1|nr:two-component hybrid sensor and regulator [Piscinibacter sakaiensis]
MPAPPGERTDAVQRVVKVRRDYNSWVARETMEDYALRFTPRSFRKWSALRVANTAFGASSFLVLEAVGATLMVDVGFVNAFWAILATGLIIFLAGWPISVYAARYGVDMDLLTRGAGFGYLGSTLTSLIYASFTFIFFALEAAVMAYALELAFDIPPAWGYLVCALVVVPLVTHGVTTISRLQVWTQPLWLAMLVVPFVFVFQQHPGVLAELWAYGGGDPSLAGEADPSGFDLMKFGAAMTVGIALITQMGEQADYLRFMPERRPRARRGLRLPDLRWWSGVVIGGPGWVVPGVLKMLGGALLAFLALGYAVPVDRAVDPNQMYLVAYGTVFSQYGWAVAATAVFVIVSQLKINVTNAYAGSLAWSNFFARLTHSHPGRVVWMLFNLLIALMLMELNVFQALGKVLGLYSNIAISWMMAVVADLVINKPMGWSPRGIEFKRAHLYDINPVGVGAMGVASVLSIAANLGAFGPWAQAFSALIALVTALVVSPAIAWATRGRYYLAREPQPALAPVERAPVPAAAPGRVPGSVPVKPPPAGAGGTGDAGNAGGTADARHTADPAAAAADADANGAGRYLRLARCVICERDYEPDDMAHCPAYRGPICSLCCSLDARCHDLCKPHARLSVQWRAAARRLVPPWLWQRLDTELGHYLMLMAVGLPAFTGLFLAVYRHERRLIEAVPGPLARQAEQALQLGFMKLYALLGVLAAVVAWWLVLKHRSAQVAQEESNRQTHLLVQEIESHRRTDEALQEAKVQAERARQQAEQANQAKSRYISNISHELRTPLNSIIGYAQLLDEDASIPPHRRQAVSVIRRGGDHLLSLIEGTLDIARIESGKLSLDVRPMRLREGLSEIVRMFELQAAAKGIVFRHDFADGVPAAVRADEKRLRQILINVLGNAVKFTQRGEVSFRVGYAREMATFEIADTGPGIAPQEMARIFEPFARGSASGMAGGSGPAGGTGLGLTISKMLTDLMGGEMKVQSRPAAAGTAGAADGVAAEPAAGGTEGGPGTVFRIRLFLPEVRAGAAGPVWTRPARLGYHGARQRLLVVDNEEVDRGLMASVLAPLGFELRLAASGHEALALLREFSPHAILMDLAMPGIDGWETIRRIRAEQLSDAPVAIVSANAFEKGVDNGAGIPAEDFILKPVRRSELLDWLGRALRLQWIEAPALPARDGEAAGTGGPAGQPTAPSGSGAVADGEGDAAPAPAAAVGAAAPLAPLPPDAARLEALQAVIELGYLRGIMRQLDEIEADAPQCLAFVQQMRGLARQFQLEAMSGVIRQAQARAAA